VFQKVVHQVPYQSLSQFSADFHNSFTGTLSEKFAIKQSP